MAVVFNTALAIIMIIPETSSISTLLDYFSFAMWIIYFLTFLSIIVMRYTEPMKHVKRDFQVTLGSTLICLQVLIPSGLATLANYLRTDCLIPCNRSNHRVPINGVSISNCTYLCWVDILHSLRIHGLVPATWCLSKAGNLCPKVLWSRARRHGQRRLIRKNRVYFCTWNKYYVTTFIRVRVAKMCQSLLIIVIMIAINPR